MTSFHAPHPTPASLAAQNLVHGMRLDKFLWAARFFKSRTLAAGILKEGRVRVNRRLVDKAHVTVRIGDVLTFPQADSIRVVRVVALDEKRGSAPIAQKLYEDLGGLA